MKAASVKELRLELKNRPQKELVDLCLRLSRFKKENKELLTYLLYEADDETGYIQSVKQEVEQQFEEINRKSLYFMKKGIRKILRNLKKFIRYSPKKETEVELLIFFCLQLRDFSPNVLRSSAMFSLYERQLAMVRKIIAKLDEDLQYDYTVELEEYFGK